MNAVKCGMRTKDCVWSPVSVANVRELAVKVRPLRAKERFVLFFQLS